jgi:hypothetical protein
MTLNMIKGKMVVKYNSKYDLLGVMGGGHHSSPFHLSQMAVHMFCCGFDANESHVWSHDRRV